MINSGRYHSKRAIQTTYYNKECNEPIHIHIRTPLYTSEPHPNNALPSYSTSHPTHTTRPQETCTPGDEVGLCVNIHFSFVPAVLKASKEEIAGTNERRRSNHGTD